MWNTDDSLIGLNIPIECVPVGNGILLDHPFESQYKVKFSLNIYDCCVDISLLLRYPHLNGTFVKNSHLIAIRQQNILGIRFVNLQIAAQRIFLRNEVLGGARVSRRSAP